MTDRVRLQQMRKPELVKITETVFNDGKNYAKLNKQDLITLIKHKHRMSGGGRFTDFLRSAANKTFKAIRTTYNKAKDTIKPVKQVEEVITKPFDFRRRLTNESLKTLKAVGDKKVQTISIVRTPVQETLVNVLDTLSFGLFKELMSKNGFDKFFHLSLILQIDGRYVVLEKLAEINVSFNYKAAYNKNTSETVLINNPNITNMTLNDMLQKTKEFMGESLFYDYDAFKNNCQNFIMSVLTANRLHTPQYKDFVFQDIKEIHEELKEKAAFLAPVAKFTTRMGALWNKITGKGANPKIFGARKYPLNYGLDTTEIINMMCFNPKKVQVAGSSAIRATLYPSDFDLYEVVQVDDVKQLVEQFQDKVKGLVNKSFVYVGDIKAGELKDLEVLDRRARIVKGKVVGYDYKTVRKNIKQRLQHLPKEEIKALIKLVKPKPTTLEFLDIQNKLRYHILRWTPKDVMRGKLTIGKHTISLRDALQTDGIFKLDVIGYTRGKFYDFSIIYELKNSKTNKRLNNFTVNVKKNLEEQIVVYLHQKHYFKALKREFSLLKYLYHTTKNKTKKETILKRLKDLTSFFNGDIGILYSVVNDITAILSLYELEDDVPTEKILNTINSFIYRLSSVYELDTYLKKEKTIITNIKEIIKKPKTIVKRLPVLQERLQKMLDETSRKHITR